MSNFEPKLVTIDGFLVSGLSVRTKNSDEFNPSTAKIPTLWQQFMMSDLLAEQGKSVVNPGIYGVYSDYESDATGYYQVTAGISADSKEIRAELRTVKIQTGSYLVFSAIGPMPESVIKTWQHIWSFFVENQQYQRHFISDFELYSGSDEVAIYIGIKAE